MDFENGAGLLHRLTSYYPDRTEEKHLNDPLVRVDFAPGDPEIRPPATKQYDPGLPVTPLPRDLPRPALLGGDDLVTLLFTCVGVPEYESKAGGGPGAPVEVKVATPRMAGE